MGNDDCTGAVNLCAQQPVATTNNGAVNDVTPCGPSVQNEAWYSFTTNSVGGVVNVGITNINCPPIAGMDNELSAVVLSGNCANGTFTNVGACEQDSSDFTLTTGALLPSTVYYVVVGGVQNNGALQPAECAFTLTTEGPGADIAGIDLNAGPDVTLSQGSSTQLLATSTGNNFSWNPPSGLSSISIADPFAQPAETTTYTVESQINGCTYFDDVIVEVKRLIDPPNTITPNGDGCNDVWEIFGINDYPQSRINIYDRWGQRVYSSVGYKEPWDGGGLPTATYYWVIDLNILQGVAEPYTGYLTIVN